MAPQVANWLNSPPKQAEGPLSRADRLFLEQQALYTWRYFLEFGNEQNHWLIPDNVEEKDTYQVRKLSPTNLGMLLNARQAALELGLITLPEFARATLGTLATYDRLEKQRGHIYNWYDIETLRAIPPLTVSAVDSGNLAASFYTLHSGVLDLLKRPVLTPETFAGLRPLRNSANERSKSKRLIDPGSGTGEGEASIRLLIQDLLTNSRREEESTDQHKESWENSEAELRRAALSEFIQSYTPWMLPRFATLFESGEMSRLTGSPPLESAADFALDLSNSLDRTYAGQRPESETSVLVTELRSLLAVAQKNLVRLKEDLSYIASTAEKAADAMDFSFLLVESRHLLSIGFDGTTGELHSACYDLLASEARIASFLAVAKGDIPQRSWFRLDRSHALVKGRPVLLSWTGTMFEYMMPALWMRVFPDTLIARSLESAVLIQREYVRSMPWGISESGFARLDPHGRYGYQAWGIPELALKYGAEDGPVISPYSTFLALSLLRKDALANLRRMSEMKWTGAYGFYEAADYTQGREPALVRSWMAHHQGMCLLAVTNLLKENIFQEWFHNTPRVRAAELLLHEKPLSKVTLRELSQRSRSKAQTKDNASSAGTAASIAVKQKTVVS
jgi:cyclic beta-1,2-glucan synthetase